MENIPTSLIACMLFVLIAEFITPAGKYNKYIKSVISIVFICAILLPVFQMLTGESYDAVFGRNVFYVDTIKQDNISYELQGSVDSYFIDNYKNKLSDALILKLNDKGVKLKGRINFDINEDNESSDFGRIKAVYIELDEKLNVNHLKKTINDFYDVNEANIYITELQAEDENGAYR